MGEGQLVLPCSDGMQVLPGSGSCLCPPCCPCPAPRARCDTRGFPLCSDCRTRCQPALSKEITWGTAGANSQIPSHSSPSSCSEPASLFCSSTVGLHQHLLPSARSSGLVPHTIPSELPAQPSISPSPNTALEYRASLSYIWGGKKIVNNLPLTEPERSFCTSPTYL